MLSRMISDQVSFFLEGWAVSEAKTPEVYYCPKCKKIVLKAEKDALAVAGGAAVLVHSVCKNVLEKRSTPQMPFDCYD